MRVNETQEVCGSDVISRVKINQPRAAPFRTIAAVYHARFARSRGAKPRIQFSRKARARVSPYWSVAYQYILLPADKHVLSHTRRFREPERRYRTESLGDTLRPSCRFSSLDLLLRPRGGDSFARGQLEGQGHFNPPTFEVTFSNGDGESRRRRYASK